MSELTNTNRNERDYYRQLLTTVSAAALIASVTVASASDDSYQPTVWIELGGQLERVDSANPLFAPAFFDAASPAIKPIIDEPMIDSQRRPRYAVGGEGTIIFAPEGSNWVFSASVRYGRGNSVKHLHREVDVSTATQAFPSSKAFFGDGQTEFHESHAILDFQAGKDVGLGIFGSGSSAIVSAGVRFAQFNSSAEVTLHARPYVHNSPNPYLPSKYLFRHRHTIDYGAAAEATRSTRALGPSLSWDASMPFAKPNEHATLNFDWGLNAAILFGRQKAHVHHQTSSQHFDNPYIGSHATSPLSVQAFNPPQRSRTVTIPNVGGFAGLSLKFPNAKVALGYRADFFFNAIDNGIDARRSESISFYGPFATISVGLGG